MRLATRRGVPESSPGGERVPAWPPAGHGPAVQDRETTHATLSLTAAGGERRRTIGRLAALMFVASAVGTLASVPMPSAGTNRAGTLIVALAAVVIGVVVWFLPWHRLPELAAIPVVPVAFALIALDNAFSGASSYEFSIFFVAAFVWIGLSFPPLTSIWVSPLALIAYALPVVLRAGDAGSGLNMAAVVIPVCMLVGETISRVLRRLVRSEANERQYETAFRLERAAVGKLRALQGRLREAEERYRTLVEQLPAVIYVDEINDQSTPLYVSPQVEAMIGFSPEEWRENPGIWQRSLHPDDRERVIQEHLRTNRTRDAFTEEYRLLTRGGRVVWVRDEAALVHGPEGIPRFWQGVMIDITDRKRAEEQVAFLAYHDKLTGLPNLAMFEEHMNLALARARRHGLGVAVLYVDLDKFKLVNDTLGHAGGDEVLRGMVDRLHEATRDTDLVARLGGDEFLVLLADLEGPGPGGDALILSELVAGRIHQELQRPFRLGDTEFYMSASIGISVFPLDASDAKTLVKNADHAMYRSKKHGAGGYVVFANDMTDAGSSLSLAMKLRTAVHEKQWVLHYQPIVELVRGHVVGVEALLRWKDNDGHLVEPTAFVPLAEEMGLIAEVSDWVLEELVRQCEVWKSEGKKLNVAFNLSPRGLWHPDLHAKLLSLVECMDSTTGGVTIEITESALEADPDRAQEILAGLHDHGLTIALDDFGTGYSSLSRLRSLPIEVLKIDRSFIKDVENDQSARSVVRAMIQLAHSLGMIPLGEGVETLGQLDYLAERGCTLGQGFYFSRPVAAEEITAELLGRPIRRLNGDR